MRILALSTNQQTTTGSKGSVVKPTYEELEKDHAFLYASYVELKKSHEAMQERLLISHTDLCDILHGIHKVTREAEGEVASIVTNILEGDE